MPPGLLDFLKKNAKFAFGGGLLGAAMVAGDVKGILDADNKFKALLKTMKDFLLVRVAMAAFFPAIAKGVKELVRETGSLDAALKKLGQSQIFSRQLQAFVGGLDAARKRVAELSILSAKGPFQFEDIVEANKSLEVFTRGAYASVEATKQIGQVSIATGNDIKDVARAVGDTYNALQNGRPAGQAAEQLRQMGVISVSTAQQLDRMSESGTESAQAINTLTDALKLSATGAKQYGDDLVTVTAEQEKAREALRSEFGKEFTKTEVENTKNLTAAYKALTPTIAAVGKSLHDVFGGFGTLRTSMIRAAAESKILQGALRGVVSVIETLSVVGVAYGVAVAAQVTPAILRMGAGLEALGVWGARAAILLRGAALVGIWGTVAAGAVLAGGAVYNFFKSIERGRRELEEWKRQHVANLAALRAEIAAVTTLQDKQTAQAKVLRALAENQKEYNAELAKNVKLAQQRENIKAIPGAPKEVSDRDARIFAKQVEAQKQGRELSRKEAEKQVDIEENIRRRAGGVDPRFQSEQLKYLTQHGEKLKALAAELQRLTPQNEQLIAAEERIRFEYAQSNKSIYERTAAARAGLEAEKKVNNERANTQEKIGEIEIGLEEKRNRLKEKGAELGKAGRQILKGDIALDEQKINVLRKQQLEAGLAAPAGTAVQLGAQLEQQEAAKQAGVLKAELETLKGGISEKEKVAAAAEEKAKKTGFVFPSTDKADYERRKQAQEATNKANREDADAKAKLLETDKARIQELKQQVKTQEQLSGGAAFDAEKYLRLREQTKLARGEQETLPEKEAEAREAKAAQIGFQTETGATMARAAGDIRKAFRLEDFAKFQKTFEQLRPVYGKEAAEKMATERTKADIMEQYSQAGNVVGYLQSIGGGGGLPQQGVDLQRRMVELLSSINEYNKVMAGGQPTDPSQQQTPAFFFNP